MSPIQSEMYTLNGLERATVYEASVSAKNVFGWNEYSKIFTFTTLGTGRLQLADSLVQT